MSKDKNKFKKIIEAYKKRFTEANFLAFAKKAPFKAGEKLIYTALLFFHAYKRDETPFWVKNIILGTLGYLITPIDAIPDLAPVLGYTDDLGVISLGLVAIASYINEDIREKAKSQMTKWFPNWDQKITEEIDAAL